MDNDDKKGCRRLGISGDFRFPAQRVSVASSDWKFARRYAETERFGSGRYGGANQPSSQIRRDKNSVPRFPKEHEPEKLQKAQNSRLQHPGPQSLCLELCVGE